MKGFEMPVDGAVSLPNITSLLNGKGWDDLGLAEPPAGANLYIYTTGHGGAVNIGQAVPVVTNNAQGTAVISTVTLKGPPNPAPKTTLQIASNSLLSASILADDVIVDGNLVPSTLTPDTTPFDISTLPDVGGEPLYYYDVSVPQAYFNMSGDGTYTLGLQESGSSSLSDLDQFNESLVAVTMLDDDASTGSSGDVDTYTDLVAVPEPSTMALLMFLGGALLPHGRRKRRA
jgi:hypothetical protein